MVRLIDKESIAFIVLFFLTVLVSYFTSDMVQLLYFLVLLLIFYFSKRDYFWLAFFSAVIFETGGFFVYDMFIGFGVVPVSLVILVSTAFSIKGFLKYRKRIFLFQKQFLVWLWYMIFLLGLGVLVYSLGSAGNTGYRWQFFLLSFLVCIPSIFVIPRFFSDYNFLKLFTKLIFILVFINLFGQILHLSIGNPLFLVFRPELSASGMQEIDFVETLIRPVWGHWICFIALFLALYFFIREDKTFNRSFLILVIFANCISIFISATRGWFIAISSILILFFIVFSNFKKNKYLISAFLSLFILFIILLNFNPAFNAQVKLVSERLLTLELIVEGDLTAGGTSNRLTERSNEIMKAYRMHPVFGNGFSSQAFEANDQHVGNQNMLMEGGIVGYSINVFIWISMIILMYRFHSTSIFRKSYNGEIKLLIIIFLGLFIIHSTSSAIYGYLILVIHPYKFLLIPIIFGIFNIILIINRLENLSIINEQ